MEREPVGRSVAAGPDAVSVGQRKAQADVGDDAAPARQDPDRSGIAAPVGHLACAAPTKAERSSDIGRGGGTRHHDQAIEVLIEEITDPARSAARGQPLEPLTDIVAATLVGVSNPVPSRDDAHRQRERKHERSRRRREAAVVALFERAEASGTGHL